MLGNLWQKWRQRRWWIRWIVYGVLPIVLFYTVENFRGWWAWRIYKQAAEARGERFDLESYIRTDLPDDENFARTPTLAGIYREEEFPIDLAELSPEFTIHIGFNAHPFAQSDYRDPFADRDPNPFQFYPLEKHFPDLVLLSREAAAGKMLDLFSRWDSEAAELTAAAQRPGCQFPLTWLNDDIIGFMSQTHFHAIETIADFLQLRGLARLQAGDTGGALDDALTLLRIAKHLERESTLESHLNSLVPASAAQQLIWEGLAEQRWHDAQLASLSDELKRLDPLGGLTDSVGFDRDLVLNVLLEKMAVNPIARFQIYDDWFQGYDFFSYRTRLPNWPELRDLYDLGNKLAFALMPRGWVFQNARYYCQMIADAGLSVEHAAEYRAIPTGHPSSPAYKSFLVGEQFSHFSMYREDAIGYETQNRIVRAAIALERFRLANGRYPDGLGDIDPKTFGVIPSDPFAPGAPSALRYRLNREGTPVIYSVGSDRSDDGGTPGPDLVWQYSALKSRGREDSE